MRRDSVLTLQDIKQMEKDVITPAEAAQVVGCDPQLIRLEAREKPENLGFPVIIVRSRIKIPRMAFIKYMEGDLAHEPEGCVS